MDGLREPLASPPEVLLQGARQHPAAILLMTNIARWRWELQRVRWRPGPRDHLVALNLLRERGWAFGIPVALGFALWAQRQGSKDVCFADVDRVDWPALAEEGEARLRQDEVRLLDADRHSSVPGSLDQVTARPRYESIYRLRVLQAAHVSLDKLREVAAIPVERWELVILLRTLPNPRAPYMHEPKQRAEFPEASLWVVPAATEPSSGVHAATSESTAVAPSPEPPPLRGWKEIIPAAERLTGETFDEPTLRRRFRRCGIIIKSTGGTRTPVELPQSELNKLLDGSGPRVK
jgi:hypothetical protein